MRFLTIKRRNLLLQALAQVMRTFNATKQTANLKFVAITAKNLAIWKMVARWLAKLAKKKHVCLLSTTKQAKIGATTCTKLKQVRKTCIFPAWLSGAQATHSVSTTTHPKKQKRWEKRTVAKAVLWWLLPLLWDSFLVSSLFQLCSKQKNTKVFNIPLNTFFCAFLTWGGVEQLVFANKQDFAR